MGKEFKIGDIVNYQGVFGGEKTICKIIDKKLGTSTDVFNEFYYNNPLKPQIWYYKIKPLDDNVKVFDINNINICWGVPLSLVGEPKKILKKLKI